MKSSKTQTNQSASIARIMRSVIRESRTTQKYLEFSIYKSYHSKSNLKDLNMVNYRRDYTNGALYFFTLTLQNRSSTDLTSHINILGDALRHVRKKSYFTTHAIVVLPDHLHVIWELPCNDADYSVRWRLIKTHFTKRLMQQKSGLQKNQRGEYNVWQKRFWEHRIRDDKDFQNHVDYIHYNPVKHGYVSTPSAWLYSSIHRYIHLGVISANWGDCGEEFSRITLR